MGLALLRRTGDIGLQAAAKRVSGKIADVLPRGRVRDLTDTTLHVSSWGALAPAGLDLRMLRQAIREETKLRITYQNAEGERTHRTVKPLALFYYIEAIVLAAWCELRQDLRHFRCDRITRCKLAKGRFAGEGDKLRALWARQDRLR